MGLNSVVVSRLSQTWEVSAWRRGRARSNFTLNSLPWTKHTFTISKKATANNTKQAAENTIYWSDPWDDQVVKISKER